MVAPTPFTAGCCAGPAPLLLLTKRVTPLAFTDRMYSLLLSTDTDLTRGAPTVTGDAVTDESFNEATLLGCRTDANRIEATLPPCDAPTEDSRSEATLLDRFCCDDPVVILRLGTLEDSPASAAPC